MQSTKEKNKIEFDLKEYLEGRFDYLEGRFQYIDKRFDYIDKRFDKMEDEIKRVDEGLKGEIKDVRSEIKDVNAKVDRLAENHLRHLQRSITWLISIGITVSLAVITLLAKIAFFNQ